MPFELPDLPYPYDALEPHIDAETMQIHHDAHHKAYVDNANAALAGTEWADRPVKAVLSAGIDVWEHAYYRKYRNKRPAYLEAWWNVVNWDEVAKRYAEARES